MEKDGKAGSYIERFKKVILSWTSYNNLEVKLKMNIKGASDAPTIANERVPNKDELSRILRMASPRGRVSVASIVFSGLRPESLGDYLGTDGIRLEDFTETKISGKGIEFEKVPTTLLMRRALSKARRPYFTFESVANLNREGFSLCSAYQLGGSFLRLDLETTNQIKVERIGLRPRRIQTNDANERSGDSAEVAENSELTHGQAPISKQVRAGLENH
jgi:hypothetical protein